MGIAGQSMKLQNFIASSLGNIIEWLDFGLFVYLAPIIGEQFFPIHSAGSAAIAAFGVFAAGFICRPVGGILFGHLGDRIGRAKALRWSILALTFTTLLVGILPSYHAVGLLAPALFTLLRVLQGLSVGGEYSGIAVYLAESAPADRRGFFTSFAAIGANMGFLLATVFTIILHKFLLHAGVGRWVWRIPFLLGGMLGFIILYFRLKLSETPVYQQLQATKQVERKPLLTALCHYPSRLFMILGLTCMGSSFYFVFFGYMPNYLAQHRDMPLSAALSVQAVLLIVMMCLIPLAGWCGDRWGRRRLLIMAAVGMLILTLPCLYLLQSGIILGLCIATLLSAMEQGNTLITAVENCPSQIRYSAVSFSYNLGNAIFGGTAPLIASVLTQKMGYLAPGIYLILTACFGLGAIIHLRSKPVFERVIAVTTSQV